MKRILPLRSRSWNWRLLARRFRRALVGAISSVTFGVLIVFACTISAVEWACRSLYRRLFGGASTDRRTVNFLPARKNNLASRRQIILLHGEGRPAPSRGIPQIAGGRAVATEGLAQETAAEIKASAIAAVRSNLALCRSPSAVIAVAEEAVDRNGLYWHAIEIILNRLIELRADAEDVRDVLGLCHYDWLFEMPTHKRVIRLLDDRGFRATSWQHFATRVICFECESADWQHYPPDVSSFSAGRINAYFGDDGRFLDWSRVSELPRE